MVKHPGVIERTLAWGQPRLSVFTYKCHNFLETSLFHKNLAAILITFLIAMIKYVTDSHWTGRIFILAPSLEGRRAESLMVGPAHAGGCVFTFQ